MFKNKKFFRLLCIGLSLSILILPGCGKKTTVVGNQDVIDKLTAENDSMTDKADVTYGETRDDVMVSGTHVKTYPSYKADFYGSKVDFLDVDFKDYNIGVSLPVSIFDPDNLYYLGKDTDGNILIKSADANKIILNFMDDYHFTLFCYSTGVFSTWSYTIDEETLENLKYADAFTIMDLFENETQISYKNGYEFDKHYDNKEENAYRIIMEIDYYPFEESSSSLFYHGYVTLLVKGDQVRAICFAEPKFNDTAPYQMGYPVSTSSYWLDLETKQYDESEDLMAEINKPKTPIIDGQEQSSETSDGDDKENHEGFSQVETPMHETFETTPTPTKTPSLSEEISLLN